MTMMEVRKKAQIIRPSKSFSRAYSYHFVKRNEKIIKPASMVRIDPNKKKCTRKKVEKFFNNLSFLSENKEYLPEMIWNFDETMVRWNSKRCKVLVPSYKKNGLKKEKKPLFHITLGIFINASGDHCKPFIILPLKNIPKNISRQTIELFSWSGQNNGWINEQIFKESIEKIFLRKIREIRKLKDENLNALLILDSHNSRNQPDLLETLKKERIDVLTLSSHSTHLLQPFRFNCKWIF